MGLIWEIIKTLAEGETLDEQKKKIEDREFDDEAEAFGLTEYEKKECKKAGMTPEEWDEEEDD